jgi:hypothetical protein
VLQACAVEAEGRRRSARGFAHGLISAGRPNVPPARCRRSSPSCSG